MKIAQSSCGKICPTLSSVLQGKSGGSGFRGQCQRRLTNAVRDHQIMFEQHTGRGGRENSCAPKQKEPGEPVGMSVHINSAFKTPCAPRAEQYNTSVLLGCLISKAAS